MKFSRYNLVLFEKGTDKPILFNTFTGNTFFLSYEALDSIKKNDISSLDCRSRELFSRAGVIIEDTVDELRYFSYFNNRNKYFSEVLSSTIILTWSCNFSCVYCYEGAGEKNETIVGLYNSDIIGDIYYDNYSIKALDVYTLRRTLIGFCEQTPIVFDDTIRYNIYLDSVHNDTVIGNKLISILHLRGLFDKLEKGVDTPIDNRFITLSGGEKQKITLMRALVHNPSIILLDEPTSALDKDSIDDLKKYLTSIKKNRIIIISTHDKNIVDLADVTINLDKGHIFEAEVL